MRKTELKIERLRRSGPGGQHRNRRATGIRITHLPTGTTVMATERRSQNLNLISALERLEERLAKLRARRKPRNKTKPSKAAREKRLSGKKRRSEKKEKRKPVDF